MYQERKLLWLILFQEIPSQFRLRRLKQKKMSELKWCNWYQLRWRRQSATSSDPQLSRVFDCTVNGWPKYAKHVPEELRPYHVVADGKII